MGCQACGQPLQLRSWKVGTLAVRFCQPLQLLGSLGVEPALSVCCRWYPATVVGLGHKGQHGLLYDDGEHDIVTLARERVQWVGLALAPVQAGLPAGGIPQSSSSQLCSV